MPPEFTVFLVLTFALFVQGLVGFGSALVAMPLLVPVLGLTVAAPLFAIIAGLGELVLILRYRHEFRIDSVWRLCLAALVGIPIGITLVVYIPENVMLFLLGLVVLGYAFYALLAPQIPKLDPRWAFAFGFVSGMLSGAYNTGGPPFVIFGTSQRWPPAEFKVNLQSAFIVSSVTVLIGHTLAGRMTGEVLRLALAGLPALLIGFAFSFYLERFISPQMFRRAVLILLIVIGLTLIF